MADTFPTRLFGFVDKEIDIERQTLRGGEALTGDEDVVSTDGGGRVFAEFIGGQLIDREQILAWRALMTILEEGVTPIVVPFCDVRNTPYGPSGDVPHSDDTPFSDDALYSGGAAHAVVSEPAALRATTLEWAASVPQPLLGGEWFSIEHPNKGWRAYRIARLDGDTVQFRPPLREAVPAGTKAELRSPRCLMRQDTRASTRTTMGRQGDATIRFVEAP